MLNELDVREALISLLYGDEVLDESLFEGSTSKSFEEAQLLTIDEGVVVRLVDGSAFQITIVKSN